MASRMIAIPTGTFTKKIHCQPRYSVRIAAEQHADSGTAPRDRAPDPERLVALGTAVAERRVDDRERRGRDDRAAEPLERAERDQPRAALREAAHERAEREHRHTDHEHAAATEHVRRAAAEEQEAAERERVGGDDPLERRLRELEVDRDGRERDVHDRDVEHDHEERAQTRTRAASGSGSGVIAASIMRTLPSPAGGLTQTPRRGIKRDLNRVSVSEGSRWMRAARTWAAALVVVLALTLAAVAGTAGAGTRSAEGTRRRPRQDRHRLLAHRSALGLRRAVPPGPDPGPGVRHEGDEQASTAVASRSPTSTMRVIRRRPSRRPAT